MFEATTLDRFELERFFVIIEFSLRITERHQFFTWSQGVLQGLLPHAMLACVVGDSAKQSYRIEYFSADAQSDPNFAEMCDADSGILLKVMRLWEKSNWRPVLIDPSIETGSDKKLAGTLAHFQLGNVVAQGAHAANGEPSSFFCFFRVPGPLSERHGYLIELLTPYLHAAWTRMHISNVAKPQSVPFAKAILTDREREILQWIHDGKSSIEIGLILKLSPLTVKNHVQKFLRKLKVQNRAQAVAKGLALNIIKAN
jgi:transcriptional regulator EpsA